MNEPVPFDAYIEVFKRGDISVKTLRRVFGKAILQALDNDEKATLAVKALRTWKLKTPNMGGKTAAYIAEAAEALPQRSIVPADNEAVHCILDEFQETAIELAEKVDGAYQSLPDAVIAILEKTLGSQDIRQDRFAITSYNGNVTALFATAKSSTAFNYCITSAQRERGLHLTKTAFKELTEPERTLSIPEQHALNFIKENTGLGSSSPGSYCA